MLCHPKVWHLFGKVVPKYALRWMVIGKCLGSWLWNLTQGTSEQRAVLQMYTWYVTLEICTPREHHVHKYISHVASSNVMCVERRSFWQTDISSCWHAAILRVIHRGGCRGVAIKDNISWKGWILQHIPLVKKCDSSFRCSDSGCKLESSKP